MARFILENKGTNTKQRKEILERKKRIAEEVDNEMDQEFLKPSLTTASKNIFLTL